MNDSIQKIQVGLRKYLNIMERLHQTDVATDMAFRRSFNGFYRIRRRTPEFYARYYEYLETNKGNQSVTFEDILLYFYHALGRVEASFSSKLLATIRPEMPVWDTYVLQNLGLKPPYYGDKNRITKVTALYNTICNWYQTEDAFKNLTAFELHFPNTPITNVKKIDLMLWQTRSQ